MAPPNYFRFIVKDYVDPLPTEAAPAYPTWNYQFHYWNGSYTYNSSMFTIGQTGSMTGDLQYNWSDGGRTHYLQATGSENSLDIRNGSIIWEFQPDSSTSGMDEWGIVSSMIWSFAPYNLESNSNIHRVGFYPGNYNNGGYYEKTTATSYRSNVTGVTRNMWFQPASTLLHKYSDIIFRFKISYTSVAENRYNIIMMAKTTSSSVEWSALEAGSYNSSDAWAVSSANTTFAGSDDADYQFYPTFYFRLYGNHGGNDASFKYFKMWYQDASITQY